MSTDSGSRSFGDVYSVRGLTNTVFFGSPATTLYVDDVPFGETFTYAQLLSAVNSVEALRGPRPMVVGRNTVTGQSLDGNTPPFVPEFDATVALDLHLDAGFFARVEYLALGNTKYDDFNREEFQQDSFGLLNAAVGWRARNWSISLYGTNLAGEEYYTTMNTDVRTGAPGAPREFGVRVGVRF